MMMIQPSKLSLLLALSFSNHVAAQFEAIAGLLENFPPAPICIPGAPQETVEAQDAFLANVYQSPHSTVEDIHALSASLNLPIDNFREVGDFQPSVILIAGGSKGIGRATACYWAARGKEVISLATTDDLIPSDDDCPESDNIENHIYDISRGKQGNKPLSKIVDGRTIDLLILNAGKDVVGAMRDFDMDDLERAYNNNVFGLHHVWRETREFLNPDFAVVLGAASVSAVTRVFGRRSVYHMTKQSVHDLILAYAIEEEFVQPKTYYASILHGDIATEFAKAQILPTKMEVNDQCLEDEFPIMGQVSNAYLQNAGLDAAAVADQYHSIYTFNKIVQVFLDGIANGNLLPMTDIPVRSLVPQSYKVEPDDTPWRINKAEFNHNLVPPGATNACYGQWWGPIASVLEGGCELPTSPGNLLCEGLEFLSALIDPRVDMECQA